MTDTPRKVARSALKGDEARPDVRRDDARPPGHERAVLEHHRASFRDGRPRRR